MAGPRERSVTPKLSVRLLGPPVVERDGAPISVDTRKAIALLAYLVVSARPQPRDTLTELLWPDQEPDKARGALRRTLSVLNTGLGGIGLSIDRRVVAFIADEAWVDIAEFRSLSKNASIDALHRAVDLYRSDFLDGFGLRDAPEFDDWQLVQAAELRRELARCHERLATELANGGDLDAAIDHARRWLDLDPLQEGAHRQLIRLHTRKGDRAAAVRQYRDCVALLERELGVGPDAQTTELYEAAHAESAPSSERPDTTKLHELLGDLLTLQGRYRDAQRSYETAIATGARIGVVEGKIGDVRQRLGDFEGAEAHYVRALSYLEASEHRERAGVLADRSLNAHRRGRTDDANGFAAQALGEAEAAADDRARAEAHNVAGILATHGGNLEGARAHLEASLEIAERLDDPVSLGAALNNLALALKGAEIERALALSQRALDLCARVGDRHREAAMHSNLADLLRAAGRRDEAMGHLRMSAAIFAELGEPDELQPEIWKLVEW